jgi:cytochrome c nitrite reductase small subunit
MRMRTTVYWAIGGVIGVLIVAGLGALFLAPQGLGAYLSDNPEACNNCHVMNASYEGWFHAAHRRVAVCNDCHTPHEFPLKWATKVTKGMQHVYFYTTYQIPAQIRADPLTRQIVQANCVRCHFNTVSGQSGLLQGERFCFDCHRTVAHGERRSIAFGTLLERR